MENLWEDVCWHALRKTTEMPKHTQHKHIKTDIWTKIPLFEWLLSLHTHPIPLYHFSLYFSFNRPLLTAFPSSSILLCSLYQPPRHDGASVAVRFLWAFSSGWAPQGSPCCHYLHLMSRHYGSTPSTAAHCRNHTGALPQGNTCILLRVDHENP